MAERYDRPSFGRNPTVNVAVTNQKIIGASFLEALKEIEQDRKAEIVLEEVPEEQGSRTRTERSKNTPDNPEQVVPPVPLPEPTTNPYRPRTGRLSRSSKQLKSWE